MWRLLPEDPAAFGLTHRELCVALLAPALVAQTDWTQLTPSNTPFAFTAHAMAYHLPSDTTVLFGGTVGGVRYNETWLWNGSDWTQAAPATVPRQPLCTAATASPSRSASSTGTQSAVSTPTTQGPSSR